MGAVIKAPVGIVTVPVKVGEDRGAFAARRAESFTQAVPFHFRISPEAAEGGMIGLLRDGDEIHIDVDKYILNANLTFEEIAQRRDDFVPLKKPLSSSWLGQYRALVTNASSGAVLKTDL